jgi:hypothetical protein
LSFWRTLLLPMLIQLLFYRLSTAIVGNNTLIHVTDIIRYERLIVHSIPTLTLQAWLLTPGHYHWYDALTVVFYFIAISFPYWFGLLLYFHKRTQVIQHFLIGFVILNSMAFVTYLLYPAAPPWLASDQGMLPHVNRILLDFFDSIGLPFVRLSYVAVNQHPTAAVPSLHMAFMILPAPYLASVYKRKGVIISTFMILLMLFTILYLGEHYLFDALLGMVYAMTAFAFSNLFFGSFAQPLFGHSKKSAFPSEASPLKGLN